MQKFKIGVYGSAAGELEIAGATSKAKKIGELLAKGGHTIITGACPGLPEVAAVSAYESGGNVWGFSPLISAKEHLKFFPSEDLKIYNKLFFVPKNFKFVKDLEVCRKYRNVMSTANADAGIIIAGRWGTLHEFCSLHDYGKVIGVLVDSGGIADELPSMVKKIFKKNKAKIIFHKSPQKLVRLTLKELKNRKYAHR